MAGFVLRHLVYGIVDCIVPELLGAAGQLHLALRRAAFGLDAHGEVLRRGIGQHFSKQLGKFGRMLSLLIGRLFPVQSDFRIALTVRHTGHRQVHAHFAALAAEVGTQHLHDLRIQSLGHAYAVLIRPGHRALLLRLLDRSLRLDLAHIQELGAGDTAQRANHRGLISRVNITASRTYKLFHDVFLLKSLTVGYFHAEGFCASSSFSKQAAHTPKIYSSRCSSRNPGATASQPHSTRPSDASQIWPQTRQRR